jgi:hypothetical protein
VRWRRFEEAADEPETISWDSPPLVEYLGDAARVYGKWVLGVNSNRGRVARTGRRMRRM